MCRYAYEHEGRRAFGPNLPACAQGAFLPGEEPGLRCVLGGCLCDPERCAAYRPTALLCPDCLASEEETRLGRHRDSGLYRCPNPDCQAEYSEEELARAYLALTHNQQPEEPDASFSAHPGAGAPLHPDSQPELEIWQPLPGMRAEL